jgi:hypothetical protein
MPNPTITRDILREALNKHADNGDMDRFERVLNAMDGLATTIEHQTPPTDRDLKATMALVAARPMRGFTYSHPTQAAIRAVTPKRMGGNRT